MAPVDTSQRTFFAVTTPGLELPLLAELNALSAVRHPTLVPVGGVEFSGTVEALYQASLALRCATRVLARVGICSTQRFEGLTRQVAALDWPAFLPRAARVRVRASTEHCRLHHTQALADAVVEALAQSVGARPADDLSEGADLPVEILLRGVDDQFTLSIDTSGTPLYQRGWRSESGPAPLRETLAAGLLRLSHWGPLPASAGLPSPRASSAGAESLCDPLCGSGTILIEAAQIALGHLPGLSRAFAFEHWPSHRPAAFAAAKTALVHAHKPLPHLPLLLGRDADPDVLLRAQRNAERAGVAAHLRFECLPLAAARLPAPGPGLVLTNPPYGKRIQDRSLRSLFQLLGRFSRTQPGWRLGLLAPDPFLAKQALRRSTSHPLQNGGLRIAFHMGSSVSDARSS